MAAQPRAAGVTPAQHLIEQPIGPCDRERFVEHQDPVGERAPVLIDDDLG